MAYFDNGINGGDPSSFVGYMAQRLKCPGLAVGCRADAESSIVRFVLYAPEAREHLTRRALDGMSAEVWDALPGEKQGELLARQLWLPANLADFRRQAARRR